MESQQTVRLLRNFSAFSSGRVLLLTGPAGQGKTHTLVHEIHRTLALGGIAVGVLGQTLAASGDLRAALSLRWDHTGSLDTFLDGLQHAAAQLNQRALVVIDALNEAPNRQRWKSELAGVLAEILSRPHLTIALSVRSDYLMHVLPAIPAGKQPPWAEHRHTGFSGIEPDALLAYCKHYGVTAPVAPPVGELSNPLYVQLLVKSLQGRPTAVHWLPSWLEVWEAWIARLEEDARGKLDLDPSRPNPIRRCMNKLAAAMIQSGEFCATRSQADNIARDVAGIEGIVGFLCSAGALIDRMEDDDDIVEFGFERLSDTFFADRLLDRLLSGIEGRAERRGVLAAALSPDGELGALAHPGDHTDALSHRRSGLLEALCLAVPLRAGVELPVLIPSEIPDAVGWTMTDWELRQAFTDSLRWRSRPEEFACDRRALWALRRRRGEHLSPVQDLDELIRLALIPGHPFSMEHVLHPRLLRMSSPGARDALWSIRLVPLWQDDASNLSVLVKWSSGSKLDGLLAEIAVPAARLLAWTCATSQQSLREHATRGLTRVLVACPGCLREVLPDFLAVNDDYVMESTLIAVWGVMIDGKQSDICADAAKLVYDAVFAEGRPRCHLTIRHYARRLVETAHDRGWISGVDLRRVRPPHLSTLPLSQVPTQDELRAADKSSGFARILHSALDHDFYWYVMGGTSGAKPFASRPLAHSAEPVRSFSDSSPTAAKGGVSEIFDIPLAARFVAWNCRRLGWTAERFQEFDTGHEVSGHGRIARSGRTERVGKKYQWIGWQTMLGFLADNYEMTPEGRDKPRHYETPHQIGYIEMLDPSRWLQGAPHRTTLGRGEDFWRLPSLPPWPKPNEEDMRRWEASATFDLPASDVIAHTPELPAHWGTGSWLCVAAEHTWSSPASPGLWGFGQELDADIWWQVTPALIRTVDLPELVDKLEQPAVQKRLEHLGRVDIEADWDAQLAEWPNLRNQFDRGLDRSHSGMNAWLPVPWMYLVGKCGHPDRDDEHGPITLPWPRLFREWGLTLDLQEGVVRRGIDVAFGVAGLGLGEDALFARSDVLRQLLAQSGCTLVWWVRGERRAFLRVLNSSTEKTRAWIDSHGVAYLGADGLVQVAWQARKQSR